MQILKSKTFRDNDKLTAFVLNEGIRREDIFIITQSEYGLVLFYYA